MSFFGVLLLVLSLAVDGAYANRRAGTAVRFNEARAIEHYVRSVRANNAGRPESEQRRSEEQLGRDIESFFRGSGDVPARLRASLELFSTDRAPDFERTKAIEEKLSRGEPLTAAEKEFFEASYRALGSIRTPGLRELLGNLPSPYRAASEATAVWNQHVMASAERAAGRETRAQEFVADDGLTTLPPVMPASNNVTTPSAVDHGALASRLGLSSKIVGNYLSPRSNAGTGTAAPATGTVTTDTVSTLEQIATKIGERGGIEGNLIRTITANNLMVGSSPEVLRDFSNALGVPSGNASRLDRSALEGVAYLSHHQTLAFMDALRGTDSPLNGRAKSRIGSMNEELVRLESEYRSAVERGDTVSSLQKAREILEKTQERAEFVAEQLATLTPTQLEAIRNTGEAAMHARTFGDGGRRRGILDQLADNILRDPAFKAEIDGELRGMSPEKAQEKAREKARERALWTLCNCMSMFKNNPICRTAPGVGARRTH